MTHDSPWLTRAQAANYLQVSIKTIQRAIDAGTLKASKIGRTVRIHKDDIDHYLRDNPKALRTVA